MKPSSDKLFLITQRHVHGETNSWMEGQRASFLPLVCPKRVQTHRNTHTKNTKITLNNTNCNRKKKKNQINKTKFRVPVLVLCKYFLRQSLKKGLHVVLFF